MEQLEALNLLLRAIGSDPVNSVSTQQPDAANALDTLNRYRKRVQKRGWWCNISYCVQFQVVGTEIRIPKEYSTVIFNDPSLVVRGTRLFDKYANTYQFSESKIAARTIYTLPWDEMPDSMSEVVTYQAAQSFVRDEIEDPTKSKSFQQEAAMAMVDLKKEDLEQGQYNSFDKKRVIRARVGVRPYKLSSSNTSEFDGTSQYLPPTA